MEPLFPCALWKLVWLNPLLSTFIICLTAFDPPTAAICLSRTQPCSYFAKGTCTKGANCSFLHIARPNAADNATATAALAANNGQAPPVVFDVSGTLLLQQAVLALI